MIDIIFVTSIFNIIWYIFSMLFVLYRFTSFFTYIFNFGKFLGQLGKGIFYIKDKIGLFIESRRNNYVTRPITTKQTIFTRIKNKLSKYIWGTKTQQEELLPLFETRTSQINLINSNIDNFQDRQYFDKHINELMKDGNKSSLFSSINLNKSERDFKTIEDNEMLKSKFNYYLDPEYSQYSQCNNNESENLNESKNTSTKKYFNIDDSNALFNNSFIQDWNNKE